MGETKKTVISFSITYWNWKKWSIDSNHNQKNLFSFFKISGCQDKDACCLSLKVIWGKGRWNMSMNKSDYLFCFLNLQKRNSMIKESDKWNKIPEDLLS